MVVKVLEEPRYQKSTTAAYQFLIDMNETSFPIDPFRLARLYDVPCFTYEELFADTSIPLQERINLKALLVNMCQDGFTRCIDGEYIIFYNDDMIEQRIRFTIAHELGHIVLNHFEDFLEKTSVIPTEKSLYKKLEREANSFARNLLSPHHFITHALAEDPFRSDFETIFHLSKKASLYRMEYINKDVMNLHPLVNDEFTKLFARRLSVPPYGKCCSKCNNFIVGSSFCKICQTTCPPETLMKRGYIMIYTQVEIQENGMPRVCPHCENEKLNHDGPYCQVCGWNLINRCSDNYCGASPLDSDARYCPYCGSNSLYLNSGFLQRWESENPELASSYLLDDDMPF